MSVCRLLIATILMVFTLMGCATPPMYSWGSYERDMYKYYKDPEKLEKLSVNLVSLIEDAEKRQSVPPGLYAEYGYLLLESGDPNSAIVYFNKEKEMWPESVVLMDTMLAAATADATR